MTRACGSNQSAHAVPPAAATPVAMKISADESPRRDKVPSESEPNNTPPKTKTFVRCDDAAAVILRRAPLDQRINWDDEGSPETPRRNMHPSVPVRLGDHTPSKSMNAASPMAPSGMNPYSTFDADSFPAKNPPTPMPAAKTASGSPESASERPRELLA